MKELVDVFTSAAKEYIESGKATERIKANTEGCFNSCIDDAFRYGGSVKKSLEEVVGKLQVDTETIPIQSYNAVMLEVIKGKLQEFTGGAYTEQLTTLLEELLGEAPKEIHINDIVNKVLDNWRSDDPCGCDSDKTASITLKEEEWSSGDRTSRSLDITNGDRYSKDEVHLYFINDKLCLSHRSDINPTTLNGVEGWIFNLYAGGTTILGLEDFDEDEFDLELGYKYDN